MSAKGHKRTWDDEIATSALPRKADIRSGTLAMAAKAQEQRGAVGVLSVLHELQAYMHGRIV
jgi:hypothetical protein